MRYLAPTAWLPTLCLCALASAATNGTIIQPAGGELDVTGPGVEPVSLIEHFPYRSLISWEILITDGVCSTLLGGVCAGGVNDGASCNTDAECEGPLTYTGGSAWHHDANGKLTREESFPPGEFERVSRFWGRGLDYVPLAEVGTCNADSSILCKKAGGDDPDRCDPDGDIGNAACDPRPAPGFVPAGGVVGVPYPLESLGHNEVPATSGMKLCFAEFGNTGTSCGNPLQVVDVRLDEYHAAEAYIYPLGNPDDVVCEDGDGNASDRTPTLFVGRGSGHEINSGHRFARNQRYAYDVGVRCGVHDRKHPNDPDGQWNVNADWYIYGQPVLAQAAGRVVAFEGGHPENPVPGELVSDGAGGCATRRCDGLMPDRCNAAEQIFPGSGNQLVVLHDSGERTNYTHMTPGSNDAFSCYAWVEQGMQIGEVGNVGTSSAPHIHISTLTTDGSEDQRIDLDTSNWPNYWTNVQFASASTLVEDPDRPFPPQSRRPRRQLDVGMPSVPFALEWRILPPPSLLPPNPPIPGGDEREPNDILEQHNTLGLPATVRGVVEDGDVGDLAIRGDAIEDIFRIDLPNPDDLRIDLAAVSTGQNLDVYALTEDLRVLNPTREGTSPAGTERMCLDLASGAYYLMVTNYDLTTSAPAEYEMSVVSDPQTIEVEIADGAATLDVDAACEASVGFTITLHDNCCFDTDALDLRIIPQIVTGNAITGAAVIDSIQALSERDVVVTGHVPVSDLTSCPAVLQIDAMARDCAGNEVATTVDGGSDTIEVRDTLPPVVVSSVAQGRMWSPDHSMTDIGFARSASDNCDVDVAATLATEVWSDEWETMVVGTGTYTPDAWDPDGALLLRAERSGTLDGRVYLMTTSAGDACGNRGFDCTTVGVVHESTTAGESALSVQEAEALLFCGAHDGAAPAEYYRQGQTVPGGATP